MADQTGKPGTRFVHTTKNLGSYPMAMTKADYDAYVEKNNRPVNWGPSHRHSHATSKGLLDS